jgi:hypothetical protein
MPQPPVGHTKCLTKTDQEWSEKLEAALTATRRDDLQHGTNAAYVHGCVCRECREHQRIRMAGTADHHVGSIRVPSPRSLEQSPPRS